jgi:phage virion morphogenesis protein
VSGGIDVRIELGEDLSQALKRAQLAAIDMTEPMQEIALHLVSTTIERFELERSPDGVPWAPTERQRDNPGAKILQLSGMLRNAIEPDWGIDYAAAGVEASGGPAIYAAIHQFGGTIVPKTKQALSFAGRIVASVTLPARPYLGFDDVNRGFSLDAIREHLYRAFISGGAAPAGAE